MVPWGIKGPYKYLMIMIDMLKRLIEKFRDWWSALLWTDSLLLETISLISNYSSRVGGLSKDLCIHTFRILNIVSLWTTRDFKYGVMVWSKVPISVDGVWYVGNGSLRVSWWMWLNAHIAVGLKSLFSPGCFIQKSVVQNKNFAGNGFSRSFVMDVT